MKLSPPVPLVRILDEAEAREFYVDFLGFSIDWSHRFNDNAPPQAKKTGVRARIE
jgi:hypothetical protein